MIINASYRNIEPTRGEKANVQAVSEKFEGYFNNIISIDFDFSVERKLIHVACRVHSKSGYYRAKSSSEDLQKATHQVFEMITKQRRRKKEITSTVLRRKKNVEVAG